MQTMIAPSNPTTGKEYTGGNVQRLQDACDGNRYAGQFATFRQWLSVGRCVRKGEKAAARLLACKGDAVTEHGEKVKGGFLKGFSVFAIEQTDAIEAKPDDKPEPGKLYSLTTLATTGTWAQSEIAAAPDVAPAKRPRLDADALREKAARLKAQANACYADRQTNTAKRLGQAMHKRMEGDRLEKRAAMLIALADAVESNPTHALASMTATEAGQWIHEAALYETRAVSNGFHSYAVETDTPQHDRPEHRAMRALLNPAALAVAAEKSAHIQAEATLRGCDIPGFFPTPPAVIRVMLDYAGDLNGKSVLEPSAGKGDIVQAAFNAGARSVDAYEINHRLADHIARFVKVPALPCVLVHRCADFMLERPTQIGKNADIVLMNPPFERDQAPAHVLHALNWLKPGGKLVAVMPANWAEKAAADPLYAAIDRLGMSSMDVELDSNAFAGADAFRQTGTRTALLVITKGTP